MQFRQLLQLLFSLTTLFFRYNFNLLVYQIHCAKCRSTEMEDTVYNRKHYRRKDALSPKNASEKAGFTPLL